MLVLEEWNNALVVLLIWGTLTFDGELEESPPLQLIHLSLSEYKPHSSAKVNPSRTMEKTQKDSENRKIKIFSADYKFPEFQVLQKGFGGENYWDLCLYWLAIERNDLLVDLPP